jgi:ribonuclease BN (tRNA processing enzyme)
LQEKKQNTHHPSMERFEVTVLGCGSAVPTTRHYLSSQVVNLRDKLFMIDCGEGSQLQFRAMKLKFHRLNHIFISHLHGDHCFGLPGLISTLGLLGRTADLHIYAQADAGKVFQPLLDYFCKELPYKVYFHVFNPANNELIFEDRTLKVSTIPLKHRIPCAVDVHPIILLNVRYAAVIMTCTGRRCRNPRPVLIRYGFAYPLMKLWRLFYSKNE